MRGVGRRLRELRKHLDMSQEELGAKLGLKRSGMGKHERGECFPTGKMLGVLVSQYNVSMDYLLCGRGTLFFEKAVNKNSGRKYEIDEETEELLSLMDQVPLVRHSVMSYFQRFKIENREIIEKAAAQ